jgi:hypothetical protein
MIGEFDIGTAKEELSDDDFKALEAYLDENLVGRGMWDSPTLPSHEEGRKGRFQKGWSDEDLEEYFDEHFGFEFKRFKTKDSVPPGIWRVHIPMKVGRTQTDYWRKALLKYEGKAGSSRRAQLTLRQTALGQGPTSATKPGKTELVKAMAQMQEENAALIAATTATIQSYQDSRSATSAASTNPRRPKNAASQTRTSLKGSAVSWFQQVENRCAIDDHTHNKDWEMIENEPPRQGRSAITNSEDTAMHSAHRKI